MIAPIIKVSMSEYCIIVRDSLGECLPLIETDYIFDLISVGDMWKFLNPKFFIRRKNWNLKFTEDLVPDSLYFLQTGMWIPYRAHACNDETLILYKSLYNIGLIKLDSTTESSVKQIFSQIAAKEGLIPTFNLPRLIEKLPYYGTVRYSIKCESMSVNNLVVYSEHIQFMFNDNFVLAVPYLQLLSCTIEGIHINATCGTANSYESILFTSSSKMCIVQEISYRKNLHSYRNDDTPQ